MNDEISLKIGELTGEIRGYQKSVEQYMDQNQREHHELFQHMNYVNKEVVPVVAKFEEHKRSHSFWFKTMISGIIALLGSIPVVNFLFEKIWGGKTVP